MARPGHTAEPAAPEAAVVLVGPTASGKTAVAHELARRTGRAVLSADSMLVYRGMDIGTAKPDPADARRFSYAGLDLCEPDRPFSAGAYLRAVRESLRGPPNGPRILCGGTGLYIRALACGLDRPPPDPAVRREAEARFQAGGVEGLREWLRRLDPDRLAALADPGNPRRLLRAIEQAHEAAPVPPAPRPPRVRAVGLLVPAGELEGRIRRRTGEMLRRGWLEEARSLRERYTELSPTAAMAIGYRELFEVLEGRRRLEDAIEGIAARTRRYAKRQMTWFRGQFETDWVPAGGGRDPREIAAEIEERMRAAAPQPLPGLRPPGSAGP